MAKPLPKLGNALIADAGIALVKNAVLEMGFLFRDLPTLDFGIDGQIEIVARGDDGTDHPTGKIVSVQVKAGSSYFMNDDGSSWSVYLPKPTVNYWRSHSVPVVLVIVDIENREAYWTQGDSPTHTETQQGFRIRVPKLHRFDGSAKEEIRELAEHSTEEGRRLARLEADFPLIAAAVAGAAVVIDLTHWHNKSSGRMDFVIGVPDSSPRGDLRKIIPFSTGAVIGTEGDPAASAAFLVPWATPTADGDFDSAIEEDLYDEYLAETGTYDSEDGVYVDSHGNFEDWRERRRHADGAIPYYIDGEVASYRFLLEPTELARSFIVVRSYLKPEGRPSEKWTPRAGLTDNL